MLLLTPRLLAKVLADSPFFFSFSVLPHPYWSFQSPSTQCLSKMYEKVAGDVRVLLRFTEDLITPP